MVLIFIPHMTTIRSSDVMPSGGEPLLRNFKRAVETLGNAALRPGIYWTFIRLFFSTLLHATPG